MVAVGRGEGPPVRVLVVDDEPSIRLLCRVNLEAEGLLVAEAASGEEALELVAASPPDVVVLDVMMPGLDGWEVAARLRADPRTSRAGLIFLTAASDATVVERARRWQGVYVPKPFNPMTLAAVVEQAASTARE